MGQLHRHLVHQPRELDALLRAVCVSRSTPAARESSSVDGEHRHAAHLQRKFGWWGQSDRDAGGVREWGERGEEDGQCGEGGDPGWGRSGESADSDVERCGAARRVDVCGCEREPRSSWCRASLARPLGMSSLCVVLLGRTVY